MAGEALDANAEQRSYWNTVAGPRWVAAPGFRERRNQESMALLLARLGDIAGQSVLEIGCGTGAMTLPIAAAVGERGRVVAVDISEPMLGAARQRVGERGLGNVTLLLGDAQVFDFEPAAFDLATSRMGVMFFADPAAAFRNIGGALKPGGPLVFACWAPLAENRHWLISYDVALRHLGPPGPQPAHEPGPLAFADPDYIREFLAAAGFAEITVERAHPDDHRRQPRGRGAAGDDDGTNGKTDRGEGARRGDAADDRARDRSGVRRGSRFRPDPAAGDHLSGHCPPPRLT
jgi:SAM-dependent methyltransferase